MTPAQFKTIRTDASLTQEGLAQLLRLSDSRSIRRYEDGTRTISGPISLLMELLQDGKLAG
jgi:DNA-binding transcriptional regulator YiaG